MAYFYDQDNPLNSREISNSSVRNIRRLEEQGRNVVKKSTMTPAQRERAKVIKAQQRRKERQKRLAGLCVACLIVGGISATTVAKVADSYEKAAIASMETLEFRKNVINPNTHRTLDNEHYFYDYDDIAEYIQGDGRDFSTELYKTYSSLGEYQTNKVLDYTPYSSVLSYVKQAGFDSIKDWTKSEREKLVIYSEMKEKQIELEAMHQELNGEKVMDSINNDYVGGK